MPTRLGAAVGCAAALLSIALTTQPVAAAPDPAAPAPLTTVEAFGEEGPAGRHSVPETSRWLQPAPPSGRALEPRVINLQKTGPARARLDLVMLGDGYTADQQAEFLADAQKKWDEISAVEPYASYSGLVNVWAVELVSRDSGVTNDPQGVVRDTALGSYFFCADIPRLLCVDVGKTREAARLAPDAELAVVVANSATYGGAGYHDIGDDQGLVGISTVSSDQPLSSLIVVHEIAHSIGNLEDEYVAGYGAYTGGEPPQANISTRTAAQQAAEQAKWYRWLGTPDPTGGMVDSFEGAKFYEIGIYRPSADSIMRSFTLPVFNLPSAESLIAGFHRDSTLATAEPSTKRVLGRRSSIRVGLAVLGALADLRVRWIVDGKEVEAHRGDLRVTPKQLGVGKRGRHVVRMVVVDATASIRSDDLRQTSKSSLRWVVKPQR